jgi:CheY-like chemotaxis protein
MSTDTPSLAHLHVLAVDDDDFMLEFLTDLLQELGVGQISTAGDGLQAIEVYDRADTKPHLIVSDLHMPGLDGFQLVALLAERKYAGGLILLSGQEDRVLNSAMLLAQFHQLQMLAALSKPVDLQALTRAIARLR